MNYDPEIIRAFAAQLYRRANQIVLNYTCAGFAVGALSVLLACLTLVRAALEVALGIGFAGGLVVALVARGIGERKAFALRLQAQQALCQVEIELNTREIEQNTRPRRATPPDGTVVA